MLFQSTLPRRERLERKLHNKQTDIISIHAPAKGATSRPTSISSTAAFQSTLPRRERPAAATGGGTGGRNFNPRSREGSDVAHHVHRLDGLDISIHAPAKGATRQVCTLRHQFDISIHAPAKGATLYFCICVLLIQISIHAPAKGATSEADEAVKLSHISIHAPAKGATTAVVIVADRSKISIHAPVKGATVT